MQHPQPFHSGTTIITKLFKPLNPWFFPVFVSGDLYVQLFNLLYYKSFVKIYLFYFCLMSKVVFDP